MSKGFLGREERMERVSDQLIRLAGAGRCRVVDVFDASFLRDREEMYVLSNFETQRLFEDGVVYNDTEKENLADFYERYKRTHGDESFGVSSRMLTESSEVNHPEVRDILFGSMSEATRAARSLRVSREELDNGYIVTFVCEGFARSDLDVTCRNGMLRVHGKRKTADGVDEVSRMVPVKDADAGSLTVQMVCDVLVVTVNKLIV